jgi:hypothetical protein
MIGMRAFDVLLRGIKRYRNRYFMKQRKLISHKQQSEE